MYGARPTKKDGDQDLEELCLRVGSIDPIGNGVWGVSPGSCSI